MRQQQEDNLMLLRTEDSSSADYISNVWHLIKSAAQAAFQQHDDKTLSFMLRITHCSCVSFLWSVQVKITGVKQEFLQFQLHKTGQFLQVTIENVKMLLISNTESETQFFVAWLLVYFIPMTESFKQLALASKISI